MDNQFIVLTSNSYIQNYKTKWHTKKTWNFKNICLYETGKVAVSARAISSDVRWRRIFHESIWKKYDQNDKSQKALLKLKDILYVALQSARNRWAYSPQVFYSSLLRAHCITFWFWSTVCSESQVLFNSWNYSCRIRWQRTSELIMSANNIILLVF